MYESGSAPPFDVKRHDCGFEASLARSGDRFGLPDGARQRLHKLVTALASEPHPPTTMRTRAEIADGHVADSLVGLEIERLRAARRVADIGSGAGFPGLPLAIALPDAAVDLVESASRKRDVIERIAAAAGVANARPIALRVEDWAAQEGREPYDAVTARAVASLAVLVEYAAPLLRSGGALVAWKGRRNPAEERAAKAASGQVGLCPDEVRAVDPFPRAGDRHLHVYVKVAPTPSAYPRRAGMAVKRPLG
jgi:16S rRNA (guanine527-N7)-methyltransferase